MKNNNKHIVEIRRYTGNWYEDGTPEYETIEQHKTEYPYRYYRKFLNEYRGTTAMLHLAFLVDGDDRYYETYYYYANM